MAQSPERQPLGIYSEFSGSDLIPRRPLEQIDGSPRHTRLAVVFDDGTTEVIFEGSEFSEQKFQKGLRGRQSHREQTEITIRKQLGSRRET